ncbi:hypothetical protein Tco_0249136, partial [Tanacetum coccineum]
SSPHHATTLPPSLFRHPHRGCHNRIPTPQHRRHHHLHATLTPDINIIATTTDVVQPPKGAFGSGLAPKGAFGFGLAPKGV